MSARVRRPPILAALPRPHAVIEASAGTGKTYTLERLVVDLLVDGTARLDQMLVVTFTEKAAAEIRIRVRAMLERLLGSEEALAAPGESAWTLDDATRARLRAALRDFDAASISTIHGFCQRVLTETSFAAGRAFDQTLAAPDEVFDDVFRRLLRERFATDPRVTPFLESSGADALSTLLHALVRERGLPLPDTRPLHEIARELAIDELAFVRAAAAIDGAAGSKKTATTTREALAEMQAIVATLRRGEGTTEELGARYAAWSTVLRTKGGKEASAVGKCLTKAWAAAIGEQAASDLFFLLDSFAPSELSVVRDACLGPFIDALRHAKDAAALFDFDDMIKLVVDALEGPGGPSLVETLQSRYRVALIDEFQDTDELQWRIFERVFAVPSHRLVVIGDPKQAIYGFRGGDLPTYLGAVERLLGPGVQPVALEENFRSTREVIDAYNAVFACEGFFTPPNVYRKPVRCGRTDLAFVDAHGEKLPPVLVPDVVFESGEAHGSARIRHRMARSLVAAVKDVVARGHLRETRNGQSTTRRLGYSDVFVLVGKASEGAYVADQFRAAGVPVAFFKQRGLFSTREAHELLDVLRAVESPSEPSRFVRAAQTMYFGYGVEDLERLTQAADDHPLRDTFRRLRSLADRGDLSALLGAILDETEIRARLLLCEDGERRRTNVEHLVDVLAMEARTKDLAELVRAFASYVAGHETPEGESGDVQRLESREDAVQILTLHVSKGLERAIVAVFAPGRPSARVDVAVVHDATHRRRVALKPKGAIAARLQAEIAEERQRLAYVALTRAKACLVLPRVVLPAPTPKANAKESEEGQDEARDPFQGSYAAIHPFVARLVAEGHPSFALHSTRRALLASPAPRVTPDLASIVLPEPVVPPRLAFDRIRASSRPVVDASFSLLDALGDDVRHADADSPVVTIGPDQLPAGRTTGVLLHGLLERVPLLGREESLEAFTERTRTLIADELPNPVHAKHATKLVHAALHAVLPVHGGGVVSLATIAPSKVAREMDFLSPYLDSEDYLTGSLDVCFEHEGRVYVLDWKSNLLPAYDERALAPDVSARYELQLRIYSLAAARFVGIEDETAYEARFGGVHYVYLRGLPDHGVYTRRPSFADLESFRTDLASRREALFHG